MVFATLLRVLLALGLLLSVGQPGRGVAVPTGLGSCDGGPGSIGSSENRPVGVSGAATASFVYMVPASGGTATKLGGNHTSYDDAHPVWPAPGGEVLFASWRAGGGDLYKVPASSTGSATALSGNHSTAEDSHPDWQLGVSYPSANTLKHYYVSGQRIATRDSEGLKFIHSDHLGSTSRVTNPSGSQVGVIRYDPWGYTQAAWGSGTAAVKYTYTGKELDAGTGLTGGAVHQRGPVGAQPGKPLGAEPVCVCPEQPDPLHRPHRALGRDGLGPLQHRA